MATHKAAIKQSAPPTAGVVGGYSYPNYFPYDSVKEVIRMVTAKTMLTEKAAFGKHVWVVQGYAQSTLFGDPDANPKLDSGVIGGMTVSPQDDMVVGILNSLLESNRPNQVNAQAESGATVKLSAPAAMSTLLQWAVTKLLELVEQELAAAIV